MKSYFSKWLFPLILAVIGVTQLPIEDRAALIALTQVDRSQFSHAAQTHDSATAVTKPPESSTNESPTPVATPSPVISPQSFNKYLNLRASPFGFLERHDVVWMHGHHHVVFRDSTGRIIAVRDFFNAFTTAGKNYLLNAGIANGTSAITTWYVATVGENRHVSDAKMGAADWASTHAYVAGGMIIPLTNNAGGYTYRETVSTCNSNSSRPSPFNQTPGGTPTSDGTCSWTNEGLNAVCSATASWQNNDNGRNVTILGAGASGAQLATTVAGTPVDTTCAAMANAPLTNVSGVVASIGPAFAAADTAASHTGWTPIGSGSITNSVWPTWTPGTVSAGSVTNSGSPAVLTMGAAVGTVYLHGLALTSSSALATSSGTLFSEIEFTGGAVIVNNSYTITDTYSVSLT